MYVISLAIHCVFPPFRFVFRLTYAYLLIPVYVTNLQIRDAKNPADLMRIFEEGSKNRHVASTHMNAESSRSHLVIGIIVESINKTNGNVLKVNNIVLVLLCSFEERCV